MTGDVHRQVANDEIGFVSPGKGKATDLSTRRSPRPRDRANWRKWATGRPRQDTSHHARPVALAQFVEEHVAQVADHLVRAHPPPAPRRVRPERLEARDDAGACRPRGLGAFSAAA
jgi:hypothetical protein